MADALSSSGRIRVQNDCPPHTLFTDISDMETNLVQFVFRRLGSGLWLDVEAVPGGQQQFAMEHVHRMRVRSEGDLLRALQEAGVGQWNSFPVHPIQATVTRLQLRSIGFRGNY